jgi:hypothetical protein
VYGWCPSAPDYASNASLVIQHADGRKQLTVNQQNKSGQWVKLGTFRFEKGYNGAITVGNQATDGLVVADAFKFERVK